MSDAAPIALKCKILVIDDDVACREGILLALRDYETVTAVHGQQALDLLRAGLRPNLIFCDLTMPVMDGWGFCRVWSRDPELSRIPVILVSGEAHLDRIAKDLQVSGWLQKPIDLEDVDRILALHVPSPV